jgi:hypothetical protein
VLSETFKRRFDWFGLGVGLATIVFGLSDRLHGGAAHGDYMIVLGIVAALIAGVSLARRARA